jgi:mono/diheme cytochrome c family protein
MFKSVLLVIAVALIALTFGASPSGGAQAPAAKPSADSQAKAKQLYAMDCAMCHGDNGNGQSDIAKSMDLTLLDWTNPATLSSMSDADLFAIIRNGKDKMPPEDTGRVNDAGVRNLIVYIRTFSKGQAAAPAPPTNLTGTAH